MALIEFWQLKCNSPTIIITLCFPLWLMFNIDQVLFSSIFHIFKCQVFKMSSIASKRGPFKVQGSKAQRVLAFLHSILNSQRLQYLLYTVHSRFTWPIKLMIINSSYIKRTVIHCQNKFRVVGGKYFGWF